MSDHSGHSDHSRASGDGEASGRPDHAEHLDDAPTIDRLVTEAGSGPGTISTMLRAALPAIPGVNLLPGIAKSGDTLPDLRYRREDVAVDPVHVAAYAEVCGFGATAELPLTYPHMLAFGLHMAIMTAPEFPFPAIGTLHLGNSITQHRRIAPTERLTVATRAQNLRAHPKGRVFDMRTTVASDGETVWESTSNYLRLGGGDSDAPVEYDHLTVVSGTPIEWRLDADLGRRYAAVSGDYNPIHLYPLTAKALGFRRQIAHGMWSKARSVAMLANRLPDAVTVEVAFKRPIFLPGRVAFTSRLVDAADSPGGYDFSLVDPRSGAPHLVGRARRS